MEIAKTGVEGEILGSELRSNNMRGSRAAMADTLQKRVAWTDGHAQLLWGYKQLDGYCCRIRIYEVHRECRSWLSCNLSRSA